jgi:hypothetical protein
MSHGGLLIGFFFGAAFWTWLEVLGLVLYRVGTRVGRRCGIGAAGPRPQARSARTGCRTEPDLAPLEVAA